MKYVNSLIIKKCIVGTLSLGLAGSGTNKFSSLRLENLKYRPLDDAAPIAFLMMSTVRQVRSVKYELDKPCLHMYNAKINMRLPRSVM